MSSAKDGYDAVKNKLFGSTSEAYTNSGTGSAATYSDASDAYANQWDNFIQFTSVISETSVKFKAFLTDFSDEFKSEWNSEQVYGRNDPIQTFKNTTRTINIGWDSPAGTAQEAEFNMRAAAQLTRMLYPGYTKPGNVSTIDRAPVIKVKFRNLIRDSGGKPLLVTLSGLTFSPDLEAGFFDHRFAGGDEGARKLQLMPKLLKFSCTMTVLHRKTIGWDKNGNWPDDLNTFPNLITAGKKEAPDDDVPDEPAGAVGEGGDAANGEEASETADDNGLQNSDDTKRKQKKIDRLKKKSAKLEEKIRSAGGTSELATTTEILLNEKSDWLGAGLPTD